jgi:DNA invertase Pin-like site-specific DNA recombinase
MRITKEKKEQILQLRATGLSYAQIVNETGVGRTSVIKIVKSEVAQNQPVEAKVKKLCPNPRLIIIYFNDDLHNDAKCIIQAGLNYPIGNKIQVRKVETSEEPLYRIAKTAK